MGFEETPPERKSKRFSARHPSALTMLTARAALVTLAAEVFRFWVNTRSTTLIAPIRLRVFSNQTGSGPSALSDRGEG